MEHQGRRGRHGNKGHSRPNNLPYRCHSFITTSHCKPWSFLSGFYSFIILSLLMAIIYMMLEYHCTTCAAKSDMNSITKNIDDIAKDLSSIKESYHDLEIKVTNYSKELPKIEGQIDILGALANTIECKDYGLIPKTHSSMPNVGVHRNNLVHERNTSRKYTKYL